jgi:putative transposase
MANPDNQSGETNIGKLWCGIPSARLPKWDYGGRGTYFVTLCTENRMHYFLKIVKHKMQLTEIGRIAWQEWNKIP